MNNSWTISTDGADNLNHDPTQYSNKKKSYPNPYFSTCRLDGAANSRRFCVSVIRSSTSLTCLLDNYKRSVNAAESFVSTVAQN